VFDNTIGKLLVIKPPFVAWPVGFAYVLACLEENKIPFDFLDASLTDDWQRDVGIMMDKNAYSSVATGGLVGYFRFFQEVARIARTHRPGIPLILGGNITKDAFNELLFDHIGMTFGILGEAETSLPRLLDSVSAGNDVIGDMPGIIYRNARGDVARNSPKRLDLKNNNVFPAWHNFDVDFYIRNSCAPFVGNSLKFMPVLTGRGCVGQCTFCSPSIGGFRKRPIEHVMSELERISSQYRFERICFYNEMFYPTAPEIREFCDQYKLLENKKPWMAGVRVDSSIDVSTFSLMKEAGCFSVSAGIESGSDKVLRLMKKRTTSEQIRQFYRNAKAADLPANGTYIVGSEGETEEDLKQTVDLVIEEEINTGESLMYVYPGTAVYENALKKGLIRDEMLHLARASSNVSNLFSPNVRDVHINISEMADDQFLDIATREARRYNTFVFNRYTLHDLSLNIEIQGKDALMRMDGKCHECGAGIANQYFIFARSEYVGLLGQGIHDRYVCPQCLQRISCNVFAAPEEESLRQHLTRLKDGLSRRNRIVLGGINEDAMFLLRINLLELDYANIRGFVDPTRRYGGEYFVNVPVFGVEDIPSLNPDCILMIDGMSDGENVIGSAYDKEQLPLPEVLHLFDSHTLDTLKEVAAAVDSP